MVARIMTVTSGKGGVGKTTITANIGTSLAILGQRVCLIDADFGLRNLDIPLGLSNRIILNLSDFMAGRCKLEQIIIKDKQLPTLSFVSCGLEDASEFNRWFFRDVVHQIAMDYDFVLIDSPAGIETGFENAILASDEAIVVTTPHWTSIQDADRVIGLLEDMLRPTPQLIINMAREHQEATEFIVDTETMANILKIGVLGTVNEDIEIIRSIQKGRPIALNPEFESGLRFRHIARNLVGNMQKPFIEAKPKQNQKRYLSKYKRLFSWRRLR